MKDYYAILGLIPPVTNDEVKKAFRKLAHIHHPDKGGNEQKFKEINEAYQKITKGEAVQNIPPGWQSQQIYHGYSMQFVNGQWTIIYF